MFIYKTYRFIIDFLFFGALKCEDIENLWGEAYVKIKKQCSRNDKQRANDSKKFRM